MASRQGVPSHGTRTVRRVERAVGRKSRRGKRSLPPNVVIAPDLSHACGLHRPGYRQSRQLGNTGRWVVHGAAQIRRGKMMAKSNPGCAEIFALPRARTLPPPQGDSASRPSFTILPLSLCIRFLAFLALFAAIPSLPSMLQRRQKRGQRCVPAEALSVEAART
jgi:hypothetical protein